MPGYFWENSGQWYYQNEKGIWKVNEGTGQRLALVVKPFHMFKPTVTEAHGVAKEPPKKSAKD